MEPCERCGAPLPPDARFCPRCGAPVAALTTEERRVVTVLFADLVGSTRLAARLDPERFREVVAEFFRLVSEELESLRGRAEKFVGDAVMAVFGLTHAHEEDAVRAVRAALIIRDRVARLGEALGLADPLQVHVGINTGPVATGLGPTDQLLVSGASVNLASRLQEAALPQEVLVGETTWQLTRDSVEFDAPRVLRAEGFAEEVMAYSVLSLSSRSSRRTIPLVDRRREISLLADTFARVREMQRPHLFTVLGEAGMGKSRLVDEFVAALPEEARVLVGHASPFEEDVTFAPLAEMIRRELGVEPETPAQEVRGRLEELAARCCDPPEADRLVGRLGLALGMDLDVGRPSREAQWTTVLGRLARRFGGDGSGGPSRVPEIRSGLLQLVSGLSRGGPVVLVFENVHLAQPALLELIEGVVAGGQRLPLLVVCVGRDDLLEVRPEWGGGGADAVTLRLDPLDPAQARELAVAAGEGLDDKTAERIVAQTGGNPFFIIETTGMLLQQHPEHGSGAAHSHLLPPTVQAVVASRIDHLPEEAKDLVRKASVFARAAFDISELSLITPPRPDLLKALEDEEVLVRDDKRPTVWRFRHEMLRGVAYESLPKRERLRLHLLVADGLEREDAGRWPQVVAYHLEQAARASLDLDPSDRTVADRAVEALAEAGDQARRRIESRTAIDLYERALKLAGREDRWGPREAHILSFIGEARYWLGEYERAGASLARALEVGEDVWTRAHACRFLGELALNFEGDPDKASGLFEQALAAARSAGDPWTLARTLLMAGWVPYWRGDLVSAREMFEEALRVVRENPEPDPWAEARALMSLTSVNSPVGEETESLELGEQALALGERMGDAFTSAVAHETVGNSLCRMLRVDQALPHLEAAVRTFRELGARWELASALGDRGDVLRLGGDPTSAEGDMKEALALCQKLGERSLIVWTACALARLRLARGDRGGAVELLEGPARSGTMDPGTKGVLLVTEAVVALADGDRDRALSLAQESLEQVRQEGWRNHVAARVWWVGRVFGPDAAGGERAVAEARATLREAHWEKALIEPDLALSEASAGTEVQASPA